MPKVTTTVTEKTEVRISPKVQRRLLTELQGYAALATEQKALKVGMDEHRNNVLTIADAEVDADKFELEGFKIAVCRGVPDRRLSKEQLIKRLVKDGHYSVKSAQALLDDCTTEKPKKDYCRISCPGDCADAAQE